MNGTGCLDGCGPDAPSTQEYHVLSASTSLLEIVLQPGEVCDACNAYFSKLENYFAQHHPGASMRVWNGVMTRKGKTPKFTHENGQVTRVDGEDAREITTQLGNLRFEKHPNGDMTIVGNYQPRPFDASKISRVIHKIAFEILLNYRQCPDLNPRSERFLPLREFIRRPKNADEFRPFAWKRHAGPQEPPLILSLHRQATDDYVADVCEVRFPGITYMIAYPPWPTPPWLWNDISGAKVVTSPGLTTLDPEELKIPLILRREEEPSPNKMDDTPVAGPDIQP